MTVQRQRPSASRRSLREALLETLFRPMGVDGVYGRTGANESDRRSARGDDAAPSRPPYRDHLRFPPVVSRALIEKSGYLKSFPHLLGCVCALSGSDAEIGAAVDRFVAGKGVDETSWAPTSSFLRPAACYPRLSSSPPPGDRSPDAGLIF